MKAASLTISSFASSNLHMSFYGIWIIDALLSHAETVRMERPTEETRVLAVVTQCGDSPSDPDPQNQPQPQPAELKHHRNGETVCFWPRVWRMALSKSGMCWQVRSLLFLLGEDVICVVFPDKKIKYVFMHLQARLCLISMATKALWGTLSSLRMGRSHSYHLLGIRPWGSGTWIRKVCALFTNKCWCEVRFREVWRVLWSLLIT